MNPIIRIPLFDLLECLSDTMDLMSPVVANHHMRVAYIAWSLAREMGWPGPQCAPLVIAGATHDIGGFSQQERADLLAFDVEQPHHHARVGHRLLGEFLPFEEAATLVRFHHVPWMDGAGREFEGREVPRGSHILHLADRIAVLMREDEPALRQARRVREKLAGTAPAKFIPELMEAFNSLAAHDYFWLDAISTSLGEVLRRRVVLDDLYLNMDELLSFSSVLRRLIDFRSPFTANHSSGVSACAVGLARLTGFGEYDLRLIQIAGFLHDIGKVGIPGEILQKPGKLDEAENDVMRSHAYYSYRILEPMTELQTVRDWGALHQEYLDGSGYPFGFKTEQLPLGAQIMSVADVFTALTEDRPYRVGLPNDDVMGILARLADKGKMSVHLIELVRQHLDELNKLRADAQNQSREEYRGFIGSLR